MALLLLSSCGEDIEAATFAEERLEAEGYIVANLPVGKAGIERSFTATKYNHDEERLEWIQIFYINDTVDGVYDYIEGLFYDEKEEDENADIRYVKKEGVVLFGTPAAIKAAE